MITKFSQRFKDFVAVEMPELHAMLRPADDQSGNATGFLVAEITSPSPNSPFPLWMTTEDDEITVGFDAYHGHFGPWNSGENEGEVDHFRAALERWREIQKDEVIVVSWWRDGKCAGATLAPRDSVYRIPESIGSDCESIVRSWTGKYDNKK